MSICGMAWRNIWRSKRRSVVTIAAMTFALFLLVLYSGMIEGYLDGMERDVLDLEVGDVQVFAQGYRDDPSIYRCIDRPDELCERIGLPASARLLAGGLAAAEHSSAGVMLRGLDSARDAAVSRISERLQAGRWLDPAAAREVVIGRRLAKNLGVGPGAEIVLLSQAADGSLANDLFTVRGVLMGISDLTDRRAVYMNEADFRELMVLPRGAHQIIVRRSEEISLEEAARRVRAARAQGVALEVLSWRELMPTIASMLDSARAVIYVIFFVVYIAVGILILNAMLMAVFERIREFGVLKAIGVGPGRVFGLILVESAMQAAVAIVLGLALATPAAWYLAEYGIDVGTLGGLSVVGVAMRPVWFGSYSPETVAGPVLTLLLMVGLAVLYPGLKAAWIRPVQAMRHQ
ncbi:MAG: ABC transporter permease [Deltaproteobacteria bacterium]|nr:ABC transporter permease [Deltaproteobacteria bacterium]